jgi:hypothetical protein
MPALSEYSNVYNTALAVLREKGFQIWYDKETDTYCAEKDGWDFYADGPCALLGLVAIYEHQRPATYSEYWWKRDTPQLYGNLPEGPMPYHAVIEKSAKE